MRFTRQSIINASAERVFEFHEQPDALELLIPPWETARVIQAAKISEVGSEVIIETRLFGLMSVKWIAKHTVYEPPHLFEDVQIKGPFKSWKHRHVIEPHEGGAVLRDEIEYEMAFGRFGNLLSPAMVEKRLQKLFAYRHAVTRKWCEEGGGEC